MNTDTDIINKVLVSLIQQIKKGNTPWSSVVYYMTARPFKIWKSMSVIYPINSQTRNVPWSYQLYTKVFDKFNIIHVKTLSILEVEGNFLNIMKGIYTKPVGLS